MPDAYQYTFRREGVMYEVEKIASLDLLSSSKKSKSTPNSSSDPSESSTPVLTPLDRQSKDAITLRARHLRDDYGKAESEPAVRAKEVLERIKFLVQSLDEFAHSSKEKLGKVEKDAKGVVDEIAGLFANEKNPLSSFEMLESGLVDGLLKFAVGEEGSRESEESLIICLSRRTDYLAPSSSQSLHLVVRNFLRNLSCLNSNLRMLLPLSRSSSNGCKRV